MRWTPALWILAIACDTAPTFELLSIPTETSFDAGTRDAARVDPPDTGIPPDTGVPPEPKRLDGTACMRDSQCEGGKCMPEPGFPEGYCTRSGCRNDTQCSSMESVCVTRAGPDICAVACGTDMDCRPGYACFAPTDGERLVCLPANQRPPEKKADGEPCTRDNQCRGNICQPEPDWPDGHCTTRSCSFGGCNDGANDAICVHHPEEGEFCARSCADERDCRAGYVCAAISADERACLPSDLIPPIQPPETYPFDMNCNVTVLGQVAEIDYVVSEEATSYTITALSRDGNSIFPREIQLPDGNNIDLTGDHLFQTLTASLHGWVAPLTVPMVEQDGMLKQAGPHRLVLDTASNDICWYVIEERAPGTKVDLDMYFTGLADLNAGNAAMDESFQEMLTELNRILRQVDLEVGRVRYHDVTGQAVDRFRVITSDNDFYDLMAESVQPTSTELDPHLKLNVFFVETITIGALGIASAIGGPPALHGTRASGVVVTGEFFAQTVPNPFTGEPIDGDIFTALIVGHEMGHYLNLYHTSDTDDSHDPILDTAECPSALPPDQCGAFGNLMYSAGVGTLLSPGQGASIKAHPLTKE